MPRKKAAFKRMKEHLDAARNKRWRDARSEPSDPEEIINTPDPEPPTPIVGPSSPIAGPSSPIAGPSSPKPGPSSPTAGPSSPIAGPSSPIAAPSSPMAGPSSPIAAPSSPIAAPSSASPGPSPPKRSRTEKKLALINYQQAPPETIHRTMMDVSQLNKVVNKLLCSQCASNTVTLRVNEQKSKGMCFFLEVYCATCEETVASDYSSERQGQSSYTINKVAVLSSLLSGLGPVTFRTFCQNSDMPALHHKTFQRIANRLYADQDLVDDSIFSTAAAIVRRENAIAKGIQVDENEIMDISVTYDGSWLTRGHQSHIGVGCVIDILTGMVIDCHILCDHCQVCATAGKWMRNSSPQVVYDRWLQKHRDEGCDANYEGTAGMMEVKVAEVLWSRSVQRHKLRYVTLVSDGDSKAYDRLCELAPYGDIPIDKEECVNHIGKRMGTALRNLVANCSKQKITLGGRGRGRLTQAAIRKLSIYYSRAIRSTPTAHGKQRAVLASLFHCYSTDEHPQHQFCPPGKNSFCFYQVALSQNEQPASHRTMVHTPLDRKLLHKHIFPIYKRLSDATLMKRCQLGATQNANESLHNSIWSKSSKTKFYSRRTVHLRTVAAIAEFNAGPVWAHDTLMRLYGLPVGQDASRLAAQRQKKRLSDRQFEMAKKKAERRRKQREARRRLQEELEEAEGGPSYGPGIA